MKAFTNIEQQIELLKTRNLKFFSEELAVQALQNYGYYEIVNGYKIFIIDMDSEEDHFKDNETFEHLLSLYKLDKNIRNAVVESLIEIELSLRTAISYIIAKDFGVQESEYLKRNNYNPGKKNKKGYQIDQLLGKLNKISQDKIEPYKHYREVHGHIPPWILLKGTTLGNLVTMIKLLKPEQKNQVVSTCLGLPVELVTNDLKETFSEMLFLILAFRNRAAHSGRLFNFKSDKYSMQFREFFHERMGIDQAKYRKGFGKNDLFTLFNVVSLFANGIAKSRLNFGVFYFLKQHLRNFPEDDVMFSIGTGMPMTFLEEQIERIKGL
ncbi:MAG: Abi family protein [Streptococcus salivarius]|nr:Abi family protein [Streptococcus salivarius]